MNVRKRPRLELAAAATATDVALMGSTGYANGNGIANGHSTSLASIGSMVSTGGTTANGLFLTSSLGVAGMEINNGAQIYLTICGDDDNSTESQEFYAIESIKQEPDLDALHHALLPTNLQLPTGCEIYLVKDTTGAAVGAGAASTTAATTVGSPKTINDQLLQKHTHTHTQSMASIKLEPDSISTPSTTNVLFVSGNTPTHNILVAAGKETNVVAAATAGAASAPAAPASAVAATAPHCTGYNVKLDAYKKRDDKRRATHNEVERRRRDKINCWIFKLKEMLPTDGNRYKSTNNLESMESSCNSSKATTLTLTTTTSSSSSSSLATATPSSLSSSSSLSSIGTPAAVAAAAGAIGGTTTTTTTATTNSKSNQNNGRTPPNDSKSQILIKACDYIKSMQNEIDSLRACLREAENLRLSNQQLREELDILKQQQELQELRFNTAGGSFNVTLNSLNSSATSDLFDGIDTAPNLSTVSSINFTKRGLMIADYDD